MKIAGKAAILTTVLVILLFTGQAALAAEPQVAYDSHANRFVFLPDDDLFQSFRGVMPGDTLTQDIRVKNTASHRVKVKIYLHAEPVDEAYRDFLSQMTLQVEQDGHPDLFSAPADQQDGLTNNVYLGTFGPGADVTLHVTLTVPLGMDNEFQDGEGIINWVFTAVEIPVEPTMPTPSPSAVPVFNPSPITGDTSTVSVYIVIAAASLAAILALLLIRRRGSAQK